MFAMSNPRPRSHSQSYSQSLPYRSSDYHLPAQAYLTTSNHSRLYPVDLERTDFFTEPVSNLYHPRHGNGLYEDRDNSSSVGAYNQPYDRRNASSSDLAHYRASPDQPSRGPPLPMAHLKRGDAPGMINTYDLSQHHSGTLPEPSSALTAHSEHSGESEFWSPNPQGSPDPQRPRKARREKPRIELAPDQPPTTQGKPRARVYVACLQCRTRKIRCDGAKPVCHNCGRRANGNNECNYDTVPKRRGPDKTPGARQRMARDVRNEIDVGVGPTRRRRRNRETTMADSADRPEKPTADSVQTNSNEAINVQTLHLTLSSPTLLNPRCSPNDFSSIPNYVRSSYPPECACHGLIHCPDLLEASGLSENRKVATSNHMSPPYNDNFDLAAIMPYSANTGRGYITELDENGQERPHSHSNSPEIASEPSLTFTRKIWWDSLLSLYLSPSSCRLQSLTSNQRESATQSITADIRFLFRASNYWFSFFHIPSFFGNYFDSSRRERIQPSLVLAMLAMATFWQSSEVGLGRAGRERALRFRDEAQSALDASFNAGWIDETLAQAAWLLSLFEVCAHPRHSSERCTSALVMLDSIIRSLSLTFVDADDPNASMFTPGAVPVVSSRRIQSRSRWLPEQTLIPTRHSLGAEVSYPIGHTSSPAHSNSEPGCSCNAYTLVENWPSAGEHAPLWGPTPAWNNSWPEGEIRKESCRRLCWSSMILAAGHISYTTANNQSQRLDLFIADPANYALLFSGESVARSPAYSSKDTIWALHDRSFLLWHGCIRMRNDTHASETDNAHFAVKAWVEADALESALNKHTCAIERAFIYQAREYIFNTRMCISYEFQRFIPLVSANVNGLFHRNKAEEWLSHQATVAERFMYGLHTITGNSNNLLARRPFFVFWFMGQISRALSLWQCDSTLTVALDVCKALLPAIDYLTALWPCAEQRHRYECLRERLDNACYAAGVSPPAPPNLSLPPPSSPEALV